MANTDVFTNPYTPGAGHAPPYLAGREGEVEEFLTVFLQQQRVLDNVVLTGLRGVGKTVLLDRFKSLAIKEGWLWAGNDLSESASVTEESLATRIIADLSIATAGVYIRVPTSRVGFSQPSFEDVLLSFDHLASVFRDHPGLVADKIKAVLEYAWSVLKDRPDQNRVVFAYDEAQNLSDHASAQQFPLATLLDVFQSIQAQGIPFLLVLTGLPTLFPKLIEARTYAERMFHILTLGRLSESASAAAIQVPLERTECPIHIEADSVRAIVEESAGYPYFIQFICREVYDVVLQSLNRNEPPPGVPIESIQRKLDVDFFSGRWARITDRQRDLLWIISLLSSSDDEFKIQEILEEAKTHADLKRFSASNVNQMLVSLTAQGLVYKNRFGKYSFAVPLMAAFIRRNYSPTTSS